MVHLYSAFSIWICSKAFYNDRFTPSEPETYIDTKRLMHAGTPGKEVTQILNPRSDRGSNRGLGGRDLHHFANPSAVAYIHTYIHTYKLGGLQGPS